MKGLGIGVAYDLAAAARQRDHIRTLHFDGERCMACGTPWPCDVVTRRAALATVVALAGRCAGQRAREWWFHHAPGLFNGWCGEYRWQRHDVRAVLARADALQRRADRERQRKWAVLFCDDASIDDIDRELEPHPWAVTRLGGVVSRDSVIHGPVDDDGGAPMR